MDSTALSVRAISGIKDAVPPIATYRKWTWAVRVAGSD